MIIRIIVILRFRILLQRNIRNRSKLNFQRPIAYYSKKRTMLQWTPLVTEGDEEFQMMMSISVKGDLILFHFGLNPSLSHHVFTLFLGWISRIFL